MRATRRKGFVLERLKAEEAQDVLRRLLAAHPDLGAEAEEIARSRLGEVTFEAVAAEVEDAVGAPDLDDLHGRSGRHEWGYVEPGEAASEILEETVEPFLDDMKRRIALGLEAEALEICKGVVLGLYRVEKGKKGKGSELVEWAPDFPAEAAGNAVDTWAGGGSGREGSERRSPARERPAFPQDFVDRHVPDWSPMIARILSRAR